MIISEFLQTRIEAKDFPSAVYLVAEKGEILFEDTLGYAVLKPKKIKAKLETIYDVASLTKVLVTGLLCAKLVENKAFSLSDKVIKFFPNFHTEITIQNLLTHTSGLIAWRPFYLLRTCKNRNAECFIADIAKLNLDYPINSKVVYSDLNFIVLTFLLEKVYDKRIDEIVETEIIKPLKLEKTFYNPQIELKPKIAANEKGNWFEFDLAKNFGFSFARNLYANRVCWGKVHDANTNFMDGVSGHAGLFSTTHETFKIAQQFLPNLTQLLKPETCELFKTNFTKGLNEARSIAFQLAETEKSTAGESLAKNSFGHLGFTGTSLWIEPETERIFILFTNRTHAHELPFVNINSVRRKFHELAVKSIDKC